MYNYHPVDGNPILLHAEEVLGVIINNKLSMNYLFDNKIKKYMLMKNTTTILGRIGWRCYCWQRQR